MTNVTQPNLSEQEHIPDKNLFMICRSLNHHALRQLAPAFHIRHCREDELDIWKAMPFDNPAEAQRYQDYMSDYFTNVYANKGHLFFEKCLFVCDQDDIPIATAFVWKAYDAFTTLHWLKVVKAYEGQGIGRALVSVVLQPLSADQYPVYLHTQPGSYRAIKLYTDFGFALLVDPMIGTRTNDIQECIPILEHYLPPDDFKQLRYTSAPTAFLRTLEGKQHSEF